MGLSYSHVNEEKNGKQCMHKMRASPKINSEKND